MNSFPSNNSSALKYSHKNIIFKKLGQILLSYFQATIKGGTKLKMDAVIMLKNGHVVVILKNIHNLAKQQELMVTPLNTTVKRRLETWLAPAISQHLLLLDVLSYKAITAYRALIIIRPKNLKCQNVTINRFDLTSNIAQIFVFISQFFKSSSNKQLTASVIGIA